jgi:tRNA A37 methylthiotransferase MiaB
LIKSFIRFSIGCEVVKRIRSIPSTAATKCNNKAKSAISPSSGEKHVVDISFPEIEKFDALPEPRAEGPKAFVSVMEGCSKYCTFCVVPYTRGEEISRPVQSVLEEITTLAEQGVREVNLLGQNVNAYRGEMNEGEKLYEKSKPTCSIKSNVSAKS